MPNLVARDSDGNPLASWRADLTAKVWGEIDLDVIGRPWTHQSYLAYERLCAEHFCEPGSVDSRVYCVSGPGTAFDAASPGIKNIAGDTIVVVGVEMPLCHWMAPGDIDARTFWGANGRGDIRSTGLCGKGGLIVGFADGQVWTVSEDTPMSAIYRLALVRERVDSRESLLGSFRLGSKGH